MKKYKTMIFDLDGTLAVSKSPMSDELINLFSEASKKMNLAIITGGRYEQVMSQVINRLPKDTNFKNIHFSPTSGSQMYGYDAENNEWKMIYSKLLSKDQEDKIINSFKLALSKVSFKIDPEILKGEQIQTRGHSQVSFSALGQKQPIEVKEKWDTNQQKRKELVSFMTELEDEFNVRIGGTTTVDVTLKGVDKEFGINEFFRITGLEINESLFIGDMIFPGGNDWAATKTGIDTIQTSGPTETAEIMKKYLD